MGPEDDLLPEVYCELVLQEGPLSQTSFVLEQQAVIIGRAPTVDFVIDYPAVSGRHARITFNANLYLIEDLQSSNGTFVNEDRLLASKRILHDGDEIRLGKSITLTFVTHSIERTLMQAPSDETVLEVRVDLTEETIVISDSDLIAAKGADTAEADAPAPSTPQTDEILSEAPGNETLVDFEPLEPVIEKVPPQLVIAVAGDAPIKHQLNKAKVTIGRAADNDIVILSKIVSRHHATLRRSDSGYHIEPIVEASNSILFEGRPLTESRRLADGDRLRIGGLDPGSLVTITYVSPAERTAAPDAATIFFEDKVRITIGRDPSNEVVLDAPTVSRYHARVERMGQRYRVRDLRSSNGTFVNDQRIDGDALLDPADTIRIGSHRFVMGRDQIAQYDESSNLRVEAINLNKWVRKDLNILQNISVVFQPREFVVVVGQSGGGKSTLVDAIAGYRPATDGAVYVNKIDVYNNFDAIRDDIGYVPQRDIIHMELTVFQALDYAAQLRMPPDTTREERERRIKEVLDDLDLVERQDEQISKLSGGQQKRVSIGVELLTKPGLFYLDEPTSGLDPSIETSFMQLMRRLADQGRTITLITHATKNVMLADKVAFMMRGGHLAWFGPPDQALTYFDQFREARDRHAQEIEFDDIYEILDAPELGAPEEWAARYREHPAHKQYIAAPLENKLDSQELGRVTSETPGPKQDPKVSSWQQFKILSARNLKILTRDRFSLLLMLAAPLLVSMLDVILALVLETNNPFDFVEGSMPDVMTTLFLLTIYGVMVGGLSQMREIVKEQDVYKRERLVNLRIFPYIMSKVWVAALLAIYAAFVYIVVHYIAFDMPGGAGEFVLMFITLALATMAGMMLGLFASAVAPNANAAPLIVVLLMLPQIVLGGALIKLPPTLTMPISTRWAFQSFMGITGSGSDVAADICWNEDEETRKGMNLDVKDEFCRCMGTNVLDEESCNFPGVGEFKDPILDEPPPEPFTDESPVLPQIPEQTDIPPQPVKPEDESDDVAMAVWLEELEVWIDEVTQIQNDSQAQMEIYKADVELWSAQMEEHQKRALEAEIAQADRTIAVEKAVGAAEQLIQEFEPGFGWSYVDKNNAGAYRSMILKTWAAQLAIITILIALIMFVQKRKDVVK